MHTPWSEHTLLLEPVAQRAVLLHGAHCAYPSDAHVDAPHGVHVDEPSTDKSPNSTVQVSTQYSDNFTLNID